MKLVDILECAHERLTKDGVPSGVISIPTRYIHSPASMLCIKDVENTVKLFVATIKNVLRYY